MKHTFGPSILIPIQYSVNNEAIGNTRTEIKVCQACGYRVSNEPNGWWEEETIPACGGYTDEPIPTAGEIIEEYKKTFRKKNAENIDKFDKYLQNLHVVNYQKKVEWDEEH